ncbi:unnamed protein product [Symbiodinium sp. KB8]|nr:unnamed protein product [Symbiodinium sp. KB8]
MEYIYADTQVIELMENHACPKHVVCLQECWPELLDLLEARLSRRGFRVLRSGARDEQNQEAMIYDVKGLDLNLEHDRVAGKMGTHRKRALASDFRIYRAETGYANSDPRKANQGKLRVITTHVPDVPFGGAREVEANGRLAGTMFFWQRYDVVPCLTAPHEVQRDLAATAEVRQRRLQELLGKRSGKLNWQVSSRIEKAFKRLPIEVVGEEKAQANQGARTKAHERKVARSSAAEGAEKELKGLRLEVDQLMKAKAAMAKPKQAAALDQSSAPSVLEVKKEVMLELKRGIMATAPVKEGEEVPGKRELLNASAGAKENCLFHEAAELDDDQEMGDFLGPSRAALHVVFFPDGNFGIRTAELHDPIAKTAFLKLLGPERRVCSVCSWCVCVCAQMFV